MPSSRASPGTIAGAVSMATIVGCGLSLSIALLAIRLDAAGFSAHAIGFNTAAGGVATLVSAPLIPWAARRLGVARLLLLSLTVGACALIGFTLSSSYAVWLALRFVLGAVVTVEFILSEFWITTQAPAARRGAAIGVYATSLAAGFAAGPFILTWTGVGGNMPFYLGAGLFGAAAMPLALSARSAPPLELPGRIKSLTILREAPAATLAALLQGAIEVAGLSLLSVYALRSGSDVWHGALFTSLFVLGNIVFQFPLGMLSDRLDRQKLLIALASVGCVGALLLAALGASRVVVFAPLLLLWGGMVGALYPVGLSQLATLYRGPDLASANSVFVMAYATGMLAGPPLIGASLDVAPAGFFLAIAALLGAYLLIAKATLTGRAP